MPSALNPGLKRLLLGVRNRPATALALALALGWASREVAFARQKAGEVASQTVTLDQVKMSAFQDQGKPVGQIGLYVAGETPASSKFVTGRFVLDPGQTPHAPHRHIEEEVMIVERGQGEIYCDGKTTKVGPGSVMFTTSNAEHGIVNTGDEPLTFYFIKWASKSAK
ncbi:MAG: cupin domain-containing protein [Isosphaeraceae bacterium]|nr:cupin domain-containing protein [Isosphaeraceae bacterium]